MHINISHTVKLQQFIVVISFIILISAGCGKDSGSSSNGSDSNIIPLTLFGATIQWNSLADKTADGGDLISDRSFRTLDPASPSFHPDGLAFVNTRRDVWNKLVATTSGAEFANTISSDTESNYAGGRSYQGYLRIKKEGYYTGVNQTLPVYLKNNTEYILQFASYGVNIDSNTRIGTYITQLSHTPKAASKEDITPILNTWTHHNITLTTDGNGTVSNLLAIYLLSNRTEDEILIDEVRLYEKNRTPEFGAEAAAGISELGIRSLRYPGGTLTDFFFWKDSIGSIENRGELMTYNTLETPVIGLHEFLNFCEANSITPLIQVNVLDTADNAADLVEYILGSSSTTHGAVRAANGRTSPWNAALFEIGNEPVSFYQGSIPSETGKNYALLASAVISRMKAKASEIGVDIKLGGITESSFQMADWLVSGSGNSTLQMLFDWNRHVFTDGALADKADFALGHFYASRYWHNDPEKDYYWILSGGEVLKRTLEEKVKPYTGTLPLWITEYHVTIEDDTTDVIKTSFSNDYQSGLAVADMIMMMMDNKIEGAYVHNLAQENCWGLLNYNQNWKLRPAGHVFKLFSSAAGEKRLTVTSGSTEVYTVPAAGGAGNVPSGLQYPLVSVTATVNKISGKPRVFIINRDYSTDKTISITLEGFTPGSAVQYLYTSSSVSAHNETDPLTVGITQSTVEYAEPFTVTMPAHSCMRIDF